MAIEKRELLRAVGGVLGGIQSLLLSEITPLLCSLQIMENIPERMDLYKEKWDPLMKKCGASL